MYVPVVCVGLERSINGFVVIMTSIVKYFYNYLPMLIMALKEEYGTDQKPSLRTKCKVRDCVTVVWTFPKDQMVIPLPVLTIIGQ